MTCGGHAGDVSALTLRGWSKRFAENVESDGRLCDRPLNPSRLRRGPCGGAALLRGGGRAVGHIGLANYGGLVTGPLLAEALGAVAHPDRAFAAAVVLPLLGAGVALAASRRAPGPSAAGEEHARASGLWRATFRPGAG